MSNIFNIEHSHAHRAKDDAIATAKLLLKFIDIFIEKDIQKINHLYYPRNKFELDRLHFDDSTSTKKIIELMLGHDCPMTLTLKGDAGLIQAVLPIENIKEDAKEVEDIVSQIQWKRATLKLTHPLIEGFFLLNSHYLKLTQEVRSRIIEFLQKKYKTQETSIKCDQLDFVLTNHLIKNQVCLFSFLNLSPKVKTTYKIPAQKKKLYNQMKSLGNRFEQKLKGKRTVNLHPDVSATLESYLNFKKNDNQILFISRKQLKEGEPHSSQLIEQLVKQKSLKYNFPENHL
jgi:DNA polymerase-3 subunit alpha (Gram-positive type)